MEVWLTAWPHQRSLLSLARALEPADPQSAELKALRIYTLGSFEVLRGDEPVHWKTNRSRPTGLVV